MRTSNVSKHLGTEGNEGNEEILRGRSIVMTRIIRPLLGSRPVAAMATARCPDNPTFLSESGVDFGPAILPSFPSLPSVQGFLVWGGTDLVDCINELGP